ncbi:hypothetical protein [Gordoniibacillus kamchatkensis]|uniref:hypothetical protein n=1 Tax=Gordoniibacillus kamchatkensis TaxID=1590651 RepID=UPI0012E01D25|nr:hypothetical protein [Paenibacillus sp. VKM B-2647]
MASNLRQTNGKSIGLPIRLGSRESGAALRIGNGSPASPQSCSNDFESLVGTRFQKLMLTKRVLLRKTCSSPTRIPVLRSALLENLNGTAFRYCQAIKADGAISGIQFRYLRQFAAKRAFCVLIDRHNGTGFLYFREISGNAADSGTAFRYRVSRRQRNFQVRLPEQPDDFPCTAAVHGGDDPYAGKSRSRNETFAQAKSP